jgi:vacuolar-type H+-ATPase subunit C/Vma6
VELARQPSPGAVAAQLTVLAHPDAPRLAPLVRASQPDLLAIEAALLFGFAERATRAAAGADETVREFVTMLIDIGNVQNALLLSRGPRDIDPMDTFVGGGRYLAARAFIGAANAASQEAASTILAATLARSPLASVIPEVAGDIVRLDQRFLVHALARLERAARLEPISDAALLRVLLLIDAQSRDLRTLAWGAVFGTPSSLRTRQLVTPE